jgi:tetratricopeptide (TPR) repeat protein
MKIIKKLFSKAPKQTVEETLLDLFYHGKYKECINKSDLSLNNSVNDRINILRIKGLANYKIKRFKEAMICFKEVAETTNIKDDWFNLCTSAVRSNKLELAERAFNNFFDDKSIKGENKMLSQPNVLYQYMLALKDVGEYQKAHEQLIRLKRFYTSLKNHSQEYLGQRAVPFIYTSLFTAKDILDNVYTKEQIINWLNDFKKGVDDYGKESIEEFRVKYYS